MKLQSKSTVTYAINIVMTIASGLCLFLAWQGADSSLENYVFFIPLVLLLCTLLFANTYKLHEGGIGVKILLGVMLVRYGVSPALNCISNNFDSYAKSDFVWAVVYQCLEILAVHIALAIFGEKTARATEEKILDKFREKTSRFQLTYMGVFVILGLVGIMLLRDNGDEIWGNLRFFLGNEEIEDRPYDSYSIIALGCIKSFLFICILAWIERKVKNKKSRFFVLVGIAVACLNFMFYFGTNRSSVIHTALASIFVLFVVFKERKSFIVSITVPLVVIMAVSLIFLKNFGVDITESGAVQDATDFYEVTQTIDGYFCGVNNVAFGHAQYVNLGESFRFENFLRDFTDNVFLFKVPGMTWVNDLFGKYDTTTAIVTNGSTAMVSVAVQIMFYFGDALGLLFDFFAQCLVVWCILKFDTHVRCDRSISSVYIYTWLAALFGMIPMYCLTTLLWSTSNVPFFFALLCAMNRLGRTETQKNGIAARKDTKRAKYN